MKRIIERLGVAQHGSGAAVEMLGASGMAGVNNALGSAMARALASLDPIDINRVARVLGEQMPPSPGLRIEERQLLLRAVVRNFLNPACPACKGRGHDLIPDTTKLSPTPCRMCGGSGKVELNLPGETGRVVKQAEERLYRAIGRFERGLSRKLGTG